MVPPVDLSKITEKTDEKGMIDDKTVLDRLGVVRPFFAF